MASALDENMSITEAPQFDPFEARPPSAPPPDPLVGRTVDGRYRIESVLGEGGMGLVYRAMHVVLNKPLAVKVLKSDVSRDPEVLERFKQEAQSASGIGNQHIIDISDFGVLPDGSTYFVMEFLDGVSLTRAIEEQTPMPPARALHITKQLCDALGAAHARNIVHRDMKPDNVYLIRRGQETDFVKVLDFGIAKVGGTSSKLTKAGQVFGTPHYMSPEQCAGALVDPRTDVYATGVMLFEMLSGRVPFDADNLMGILTKHMYESPPSLRDLPTGGAVSVELEAVVARCLAKKADDRYGSMEELRSELDRLLQGTAPMALHGGGTSGGARAAGAGPVGRGQVPSLMHIGDANPSASPTRVPLLVGLAVSGVLLVGGGTFAWLSSGSGGSTSAEVLVDGDVPPVGAAPPTGTTEAGPAPVPVERAAGSPGAAEPDVGGAGVVPPVQVQEAAPRAVQLVTTPPGAEVMHGDVLLGNTPFALPRPSDGERVEIVLRAPGFVARPVTVAASTADEIRVTLEPEPVRSTSRTSRGGARPTGGGGVQATKQGGSSTGRSSAGQGEVLDPWQQ